jgi:prepilin-type N-terminal cleavage/methylation domain-containing protein
MKNSDSKGFTLIEIVLTIVIVSVIAGIGALIILQGVKSYSTEETNSDLQYQARLAVDRITREVRLIRDATTDSILTMTAADLGFCDVTGKAVEFQVSGTTIRRRESAACSTSPAWGAWFTLASSIDPAQSSFSYFQEDGTTTAASADQVWFVMIKIMSTKGAESLAVQTRVHPMNF